MARRVVHDLTAMRIDKILLDGGFESYDVNPTLEGEGLLSFISQINVFVGENNSGKSRFLRQLARSPLRFVPQVEFDGKRKDLTDISSIRRECERKIQGVFEANTIKDAKGIMDAFGKLGKLRLFPQDQVSMADFVKLVELISEITDFHPLIRTHSPLPAHDVSNIIGSVQRYGQEAKEKLKPFLETIRKTVPQFKVVYIPMLRGLRTLEKSRRDSLHAEDHYGTRTRSDYFSSVPETNGTPEIFTGQHLYQEIRSLLLGDLV